MKVAKSKDPWLLIRFFSIFIYIPHFLYNFIIKISLQVAGKIHFGPGLDIQETQLKYGEVLEFMFEGFNSSHKINYFGFGKRYFDDLSNPLDGVERFVPTNNTGIFQYYLKVNYYYFNIT